MWWALALVALVLTACSDDGGSATPTTKPIPDVGLSPPGTPLVGGLVVPEGSRLVGPTFPIAEESWAGLAGSTNALLELDAKPFAVWDDLAEQARHLGSRLPRSGICQWITQPNWSQIPVTSKRPAGAALDCEASAEGPPGGIAISARLWWGSDAAELALDVHESTGSTRVSSYPEVDPGPAPAAAAESLPVPRRPSVVRVGDEFGLGSNALERATRFRLPEGARVVGGGRAPSIEDSATVLAVRDAHEVIEALGHQIDPTGPKVGEGYFSLKRETLGDGRKIWALDGGVDAGGGTASIWSSPDGKAVIVTTHSD